jgi:hypothetical protein
MRRRLTAAEALRQFVNPGAPVAIGEAPAILLGHPGSAGISALGALQFLGKSVSCGHATNMALIPALNHPSQVRFF